MKTKTSNQIANFEPSSKRQRRTSTNKKVTVIEDATCT